MKTTKRKLSEKQAWQKIKEMITAGDYYICEHLHTLLIEQRITERMHDHMLNKIYEAVILAPYSITGSIKILFPTNHFTEEHKVEYRKQLCQHFTEGKLPTKELMESFKIDHNLSY